MINRNKQPYLPTNGSRRRTCCFFPPVPCNNTADDLVRRERSCRRQQEAMCETQCTQRWQAKEGRKNGIVLKRFDRNIGGGGYTRKVVVCGSGKRKVVRVARGGRRRATLLRPRRNAVCHATVSLPWSWPRLDS